jgi:hypothetical protein
MRRKTARHVTALLLSPSLLEIIVGFVLFAGTSVYLVVAATLKGNSMADYMNIVIAESDGAWQPFRSQAFEQLSEKINSSPMLADITVFFTWAVVGFLVYYLISFIWQLISKELRFFETLSSPQAHRRLLIREALLTLLVRLGATVALLVLAGFVRDFVLPEFLTLTYSVLSLPPLQAALSFSAGIILLLLSLHVLVILARILLLRTRIFFTKYSITD